MLCFVVVMQSFIMNSHETFIHIHQGCFAGTGAIVRLPQCQWSKPDGYGKISQCITTTKHSKAKTVCIFLGIYCIWRGHIIPITWYCSLIIYKLRYHPANLLTNSLWQLWCRHQMETFSALLVLCERNLPVTCEFASQMPVMRSFDVFFDLRLNKRLGKQPRRRWFETPSRPLWGHCYVMALF